MGPWVPVIPLIGGPSLAVGNRSCNGGEIAATARELTELARRLMSSDELMCGQKVDTLCHFVHDVIATAGAKILSLNAQQHLRIGASSRKKTDKRDAHSFFGSA